MKNIEWFDYIASEFDVEIKEVMKFYAMHRPFNTKEKTIAMIPGEIIAKRDSEKSLERMRRILFD